LGQPNFESVISSINEGLNAIIPIVSESWPDNYIVENVFEASTARILVPDSDTASINLGQPIFKSVISSINEGVNAIIHSVRESWPDNYIVENAFEAFPAHILVPNSDTAMYFLIHLCEIGCSKNPSKTVLEDLCNMKRSTQRLKGRCTRIIINWFDWVPIDEQNWESIEDNRGAKSLRQVYIDWQNKRSSSSSSSSSRKRTNANA
jgi:hypothetical protein